MKSKENNWRSARTGIVAIAVVMIATLLIMPIPVLLLDILMSVNLILSFGILVMVVRAQKIKDIPLLPTLVLLSVIYSLAVDISASRLILVKGEEFNGVLIRFVSGLVAGSGEIGLIVGFIVFIAITAFYVLVIVKGTVRIAEVAARFALDSLPGKQMAIDAEFSAGTISEEEAKARKLELQQECDFYGALDGASRFISGSAKVEILITVIIIIAGALIDHGLRSKDVYDAIEAYAFLAIGSGILFMAPAGLISAAVGVIVAHARLTPYSP